MNNHCDKCCICQEHLHEGKEHVLECGHKFHVHCILKWFRETDAKTACPLCRDVGEGLRLFDIWSRSSYLRRRSLSSNAPRRLKTLGNSVRRAELVQRKAKLQLKEFKKLHKLKIDNYKKLLRTCKQKERLLMRAKSKLGLFNDKDFSIPLIESTESYFYD